MKSKILALSKNEEFKNLLKQKKITNKYVSIFFGKLLNKDKKRLNISFVTKKKIGNAVKRNKIKRRLRNIMNEASFIMFLNLLLILFLFTALPIFFLVTKLIFSLFLSLFNNFPKKILTYLLVIFFCLSKFLNSSFFERASILLFIILYRNS